MEAPATPNPLTLQEMSDLKRFVDPLELWDDLGISLCVLACAFVNACT